MKIPYIKGSRIWGSLNLNRWPILFHDSQVHKLLTNNLQWPHTGLVIIHDLILLLLHFHNCHLEESGSRIFTTLGNLSFRHGGTNTKFWAKYFHTLFIGYICLLCFPSKNGDWSSALRTWAINTGLSNLPWPRGTWKHWYRVSDKNFNVLLCIMKAMCKFRS